MGDIDRASVYVSLAPSMDHLVGVDPLMQNVACCYQYTSSDGDAEQVAPTADDRAIGKRPMTFELSQGGGAPPRAARGPSTTPDSPTGAAAPKRRRVL